MTDFFNTPAPTTTPDDQGPCLLRARGHGNLRALAEYRTSPLFTDRERAAVAYVEEATRRKRPVVRGLIPIRPGQPGRAGAAAPGRRPGRWRRSSRS